MELNGNCEYDAIIKDYQIILGDRVLGFIYDDKKIRYLDGT